MDIIEQLKKHIAECKVRANPGWQADANSRALVTVMEWILALEEATKEPETK